MIHLLGSQSFDQNFIIITGGKERESKLGKLYISNDICSKIAIELKENDG